MNAIVADCAEAKGKRKKSEFDNFFDKDNKRDEEWVSGVSAMALDEGCSSAPTSAAEGGTSGRARAIMCMHGCAGFRYAALRMGSVVASDGVRGGLMCHHGVSWRRVTHWISTG